MPDRLGAVARRLGLVMTRDSQGFCAKRNDRAVRLAGLPELLTSAGRRNIWAALLGVRLAVDALDSTFEWTSERPTARGASPYGEREPRLVPPLTLEIFGELTGRTIWSVPWKAGLHEVFVTDWRREWHVFEPAHFGRGGVTAENLQEFARYALFHDPWTQRPRPELHRLPSCVLRVYKTHEMKGAARAVLMPDFDWDATRQRGFMAVPDLDTVLVAEPHEAGDPRAELELATAAREIWNASGYPLSSMVFALAPGSLEAVREFTLAEGPRIRAKFE